MFLTRLTLEDYGAYAGTNSFDLSCSREKPIVLIGGSNGAGKTTLFGSIPLCLYGIGSMGKCTVGSYRKDLVRRIHRGVSAGRASITVQFLLSHNGRMTEYRVRRSWGTGGRESLDIGLRGPADKDFVSPNMDKSGRQPYIDRIVPMGIMGLFFMDGERISGMAGDGMPDIVGNAIRHLGLSTVESLQTNLRSMIAGKTTDANLKAEYGSLSTEGAELERRAAKIDDAVSNTTVEIEGVEARIDELAAMSSDGRMEEMRARLTVKKEEGERLAADMRDMCGGHLPFSLIPNEMKSLAACIKSDNNIRQQNAGHEMAKSALGKLSSDEPWTRAGIDPKAAIPVVAKALNSLADAGGLMPKVDISSWQARHALDVAETVAGIGRDGVTDAKRLDTILDEIDSIESAIATAPEGSEAKAIAAEIGSLQRKAGSIDAVRRRHEDDAAKCAFRKKRHDGTMQRLMARMYGSDDAQRSASLAGGVLEALELFADSLKKSRLDEIRKHVMEAIGMLMSKKELVDDVTVNPGTLAVELRRNGSILPTGSLSEGERHLIAICTLWALAQASGRPLPLVMDTPLARLDGEHHGRVLGKFLPRASSQCVVLSTDREIGHAEYAILEPHMSRSYTIEHDARTEAAVIHDGYKWGKECKN